MTDSGAGKVDTTRQVATVAQLRRLEVTAATPGRRIAPVELTTYQVDALLIGWKQPPDKDFHLVIASPGNRSQTMIAEIPSPTCPELCRTGAAARYAALRRQLVDRLGGPPAARYRRLPQPLPVRLVGVGFFDFEHFETGAAPNAIELHPVLKIEFR